VCPGGWKTTWSSWSRSSSAGPGRLVRADGFPPHTERFAAAEYDLAALLGAADRGVVLVRQALSGPRAGMRAVRHGCGHVDRRAPTAEVALESVGPRRVL
jgi:hypothetical protein